jgi:chaperonin GroEL (HSP60 family)
MSRLLLSVGIMHASTAVGLPHGVVDPWQMLRCVSRTSLTTKLAPHLAEQLTDIVTDAVLTIRQPDQPLDLYMVRTG